MLTGIKVVNFKCFESLALPLSNLTLLTGFNTAGKSTSLQSILLLTQTLRSDIRSNKLRLNGYLVNLGTLSEVLNSGDENIMFSVEDDMTEILWISEKLKKSDRDTIPIQTIKITTSEGIKIYNDIDLRTLDMLLPSESDSQTVELIERLREVIFLSAIRTGTSELFPFPETASPVHANVGIQGEYAPWWFQEFLDEDVDELRLHPSDKVANLRRQFNAWASELFPGTQANARTIEKTSLVHQEMRIGDLKNWLRPANIGDGMTYAFPVIVAGLLAKPKQILIIDRPEAHLHPLGQSRIGQFLAQVAAAGVQVIIETHSDHVLNGVRLAVKNQKILPEKVTIHFFNQRGIISPDLSHVVSPFIDVQGNLSEWPSGFFDQAEKDLAQLSGWN